MNGIGRKVVVVFDGDEDTHMEEGLFTGTESTL